MKCYNWGKEKPKIGEKYKVLMAYQNRGISEGEIVEILRYNKFNNNLVYLQPNESRYIDICYLGPLDESTPISVDSLCNCSILVLMTSGCQCGGK